MKTINLLNECNLKVLNNYNEILNTDYIFIPIKDEEKIVVKTNDKVLKGSLIYDGDEKLYSSISGIVLKVINLNNHKYLAIKNDYKERSSNLRARNIDNITKEKFLSYLDNNILKELLNKDINNLYINAIDDDPYIYNKYMYLKKNIKDIYTISALLKKIFNINNIAIIIKNSYHELLGEYKVDLKYIRVPDIYPIGHEKVLKKHLVLNENDLLIDLYDVIDLIYNVIKNKKIYEKYITINGNYIINPAVICVKKYSYLNNILTNFKFKGNDYNIIINNSLCGNIIDPKNIVITDDIDGVIINKNENYNPSKCTKCSLCYNVCPMKINPLIKNKKCIKCGLCNFVCPSKINVVDEVQR